MPEGATPFRAVFGRQCNSFHRAIYPHIGHFAPLSLCIFVPSHDLTQFGVSMSQVHSPKIPHPEVLHKALVDSLLEGTVPPVRAAKANHSPSAPQATSIPGKGGVRLLAILAVVAFGYFASAVWISLIFSFFLFALLDPAVELAQRSLKLSRAWTSVSLIFLSLSVIGLLCWGGYGVVANLSKHVPQYEGKIRGLITEFEGKAKSFQNGTQKLLPPDPKNDDVQKVEIVDGMGGSFTHMILSGLDSVFGLLTTVLLVPLLALFLLLEKPHLKEAALHIAKSRVSVHEVGVEIRKMVKGFFLGNLLVGLFTSVAFYVLFRCIKLENSFPLAITAGFINLIPLLGAFVAAILPIAQAILQFDKVGPILLLLGFSVGVHVIVANLVIPKFVGSSINVNATAATVGLVFWGWLWGGVGLLLAIPLTAMIRISLAASKDTHAWSELLSESKEGTVSMLWLPTAFRRFSGQAGARRSPPTTAAHAPLREPTPTPN